MTSSVTPPQKWNSAYLRVVPGQDARATSCGRGERGSSSPRQGGRGELGDRNQEAEGGRVPAVKSPEATTKKGGRQKSRKQGANSLLVCPFPSPLGPVELLCPLATPDDFSDL